MFVYAKWLGFATIGCLLVAIISFVAGWSFRFRLVGVTSFMTVLTLGTLALGLSFFPKVEIPGAERYTLIYDNGANQAVVAVTLQGAFKQTIRSFAAHTALEAWLVNKFQHRPK